MKKISGVYLCVVLLISMIFTSLVDAQELIQTQGVTVKSNQTTRVGCFKFIQDLRFRDGYFNGKSDAVLELQHTLAVAGYLTVAPTGYFGRLTFRAVINYQKDNGIIQTGFVGPITRGVLRSQFCNETQPINICEYAAPPINCDYIEGPSYNNQTHCGMVLSCNS